ncbi:carboxylesterase [Acephala macrosclerotiorum]|nr:carboxylesterase [Acephala macrosclerotiorum]
MKSSILLTLTAAASIYASNIQLAERQSNWTVGQTVQTTSGAVNGHAAKNDSQVSEYLGIPYAQPPIADLRFAAPVKYTGNSSHNGSSFGFSCPVQQSSSNITLQELATANVTAVGLSVFSLLSTPGEYSEDCLTLNVWTKPQTGDVKKAVLVWIYGGGFNSGSSSEPGYNGANIAELEDVVVVSMNYRLSILGFPGSPSSPNNLAFLDQRLAVEWVRDNIENFGGDSSRITLFGQSAGGASVDFYSYAWDSDPIAAGFIPESGNVFGWGLPNSKASGAAAWFNVSGTLGCGNASSDPADVLSCMRKQNYTTILNAIPPSTATGGILGYFGPTVDETVVFSNYSQRTPANRPMLIGNNNYEAGLFRTEFAIAGTFFPDAFWDDFNLQEFTCPCGIRANASVAAKNPTWRYRYFGVFPDMAISSEAGTYHIAEVPIIFDTVPASPGPTEAEISIANYMRGAWAAFAKDPVSGLTNYGWPTYNTSQDTLIRLAYDNVTGPNLINPYRYDADCVFVNVSSTNSSNFPSLPDLGANVTPTGNSSSALPSKTASSSGSGTSSTALATSTSNAGGKLEVSVWAGMTALLAAYLL